MKGVTLDHQERAIVYDILNEVSRKQNCDVLDLPPLSDSIDPEALDTLATENTVEIQFEYLSYTISIENGMVTVSQ